MALTLTSVFPDHIPCTGGTEVTLAGTGFAAGLQVTVDALQATGVVVDSSTQVRATVPAHAAGVAVLAGDFGTPHAVQNLVATPGSGQVAHGISTTRILYAYPHNYQYYAGGRAGYRRRAVCSCRY